MKYIKFIKQDFNYTTEATISNYDFVIDEEKVNHVCLYLNYKSAYGFGEKYDSVNQFGKIVNVSIKEQCFNQGEFSYFTFPFMISAEGFGIYVKGKVPVKFDLTSNDKIIISFSADKNDNYPEIRLYEGSPKSIINEFKQDTISSKIFPKWVLGAWMSSNRWECDKDIYEQLEELEKSKIPHNVMVIERWSDLTTFYNWWGSKSELISGDKNHTYDDFDFSEGLYKNPKQLFKDIHDKNIHVVLWDLPVFATEKSVENINPEQRYLDNEYVIQNNLCILKEDNTPYYIPKGNWFYGSMIPDFTNEKCRDYWFNRRKHLFEIGIDGFKCDGGEFIHELDVKDSKGDKGIELINHYAAKYLKAYSDKMDDNQIIFARIGDEYTPGYAITWAGDQETTWPELRHIMTCLLSSSLSGINYWGFDITGFSGQLPTPTLYQRGVQLATFVPIMQWHSDPVCNGGWDHSLAWPINDRSPWNIASFHKSPKLLADIKKYFNIHYNLIPYFYALSLEANEKGVPAIRHLIYEFNDEMVKSIDDEFMLGDALLICPILEDYIDSKTIYLPEGIWYDLYTGKEYIGKTSYKIAIKDEIIPVFMRKNTCLPLNLSNGLVLGDEINNNVDEYANLTFLYAGNSTYQFKDDLDNDIKFDIIDGEITIHKNLKNTKITFINIKDLVVKNND